MVSYDTHPGSSKNMRGWTKRQETGRLVAEPTFMVGCGENDGRIGMGLSGIAANSKLKVYGIILVTMT